MSGPSPSSSQRTVAPCGVAPATRAGQTLRGLPSGRAGYSATDSGRTATKTGPATSSATPPTPPPPGPPPPAAAVEPARGPAAGAGQQRESDQARHVVGARPAGDLCGWTVLHHPV